MSCSCCSRLLTASSVTRRRRSQPEGEELLGQILGIDRREIMLADEEKDRPPISGGQRLKGDMAGRRFALAYVVEQAPVCGRKHRCNLFPARFLARGQRLVDGSGGGAVRARRRFWRRVTLWPAATGFRCGLVFRLPDLTHRRIARLNLQCTRARHRRTYPMM